MLDTLKLLTPFISFLLGIFSTILFKRFDRRKERLSKSLAAALELTNSWYNQLHEIYVELKNAAEKGEDVIPGKFNFYVNNRLLLPKLLHHLEILKKFKQAENAVSHVETFLSLVTNYDRQNTLFNGVEKSKGVYDNVGNTVCKGYISADYTLEINISIIDILLRDLDRELQVLSVEMVNIKG